MHWRTADEGKAAQQCTERLIITEMAVGSSGRKALHLETIDDVIEMHRKVSQ